MPPNDPMFPPVGLSSDLAPWESPQDIPGSPHNLPPPLDRPGLRAFQPVVPFGPMSGPSPTPGGPYTAIFDLHHYCDLSGEQIIAVGTTSVSVLVEPTTKRNFLGFRNSGATVLFVAFGQNATPNSWLRIAANTMVLLDTVVPQDEVYCISDAAGGQLTLVVGTINYPS